MHSFQLLKSRLTGILDELAEAGILPRGLDYGRVNVEPPREAEHGDVATNAAMVLAKPAEMKPSDLAEAIKVKLEEFDDVIEAKVAGPGFINLRLAPAFWQARIGDILAAGTAYGDSQLGAGRKVNVEYVSANPTGPLHVGHGRGAVVGDALAALLAKAGFAVTREYYVNDAGAQVEALARSLHFRYWEALGLQVGDMPEGMYPGEYLIPVAGKLAEKDRSNWPAAPAKKRVPGESFLLEQFREIAVGAMMEMIREDLAALGIAFDRFSSERELVEAGVVDKVLEDLESRDLVYTGTLEPPKGKEPDDWEPRPQLLFRASDFGDDVDRPLKKSDGSWTYFATDMAYHFDKHARGYRDMIDVWGADHGGYVKRMQAAVKALTAGGGNLDVKLCQMVNLMDGGEPVKMSKRAGTFITLREVIDEVGKDVVRFIMLTRKNDAQLDFDLKKVLEQSRDNPVFYVQYSHARCHSVLRHAAEMFPDEDFSPAALMGANLGLLADEAELDLIKSLAEWPRVVEGAAEAHEPHRIAYYLLDVSGLFHALWTKGTREDASLRFLNEQDLGLTRARLALVRGLALVIASGLEVMGVTPVEEMR